MALDDGSVFIPGTGYVWVAPVGTPAPDINDLDSIGSPWRDLGHTSIEDGLTITKDGGDSNVLGTWRNPALRDRRDPTVFALTIHLLQLSNDTLRMYFGGGDATEAGIFDVNLIPQPEELAMLVRVVDGDRTATVYLPKTSVSSDDDVEVDVENFLAFPVRATVLGVTGNPLMRWYNAKLGLHVDEVQTVTITGTPTGGTFTLTFDGDTTTAIAYNAIASAVETALEALDGIGAGNVNVTGSTGGPYTVTFAGDLAETDVPQMTATASLTGGTSPTVTVTTATPGG